MSVFTHLKKNATLLLVALLIIFIIIVALHLKKEKKVHLLLISSRGIFKNEKDVEEYINDTVIYAYYDYEKIVGHYDLVDIIQKTMKKHNVKMVNSVGIMYHSPAENVLELFANDKVIIVNENDTSLNNLKKYDSLILFGRLINCSTSAGNLDLISCSVAKKPNNDLFKYLNKNSDININVSIDITGHTSDWYLEQGNRELIGKYFNDNIQNLKIQLIA